MLRQVNVFASDSGFPTRNSSNDARVNIRVQRNRQTPRFDRESYSGRIEQGVDVGTQVLDLNANDGDSNVSSSPPACFWRHRDVDGFATFTRLVLIAISLCNAKLCHFGSVY